jgi:pyrroloquinoline quinone biosynthesis protein E
MTAVPAGQTGRNAFRPYTLVAELSYRCPLRCAYCSNPVSLHEQGSELDTQTWLSLLEQAEALGVVQLHLTGGEPLLRADLEQLVEGATRLGLYSNLITSAVPLERERLVQLKALGLCNVQISVQGVHAQDGERVAGKDWLAEKLAAARWTRELDLPLTLNVVLHQGNIAQVPELVELAEQLGAGRLELANTQYLGWALENRSALLPSAAQIEAARTQTAEAKRRLLGKMEILFVLPDYYTDKPRACMDGWARRYIVISPDGFVLPCHQARSIRSLQFERAGARPLAEIWSDSPALNAFRGQAFMQEPCASCDRRTVDHGGCRCQAFALAGDAAATDPACSLSPLHDLVSRTRAQSSTQPSLIPLRLRTPPTRAARG